MASQMKMQESQLSLGGLLFIVAGIALAFNVVPHLPRIGSINPPLAPFFAVILMFGWAMIAIRRGGQRVWWIGFVLTGTMYLLAACLLGNEITQTVADALLPIYREARSVLPSYVLEGIGMVAILLVLFVSLFGVGVLGGVWSCALVKKYPRVKRLIP